MKKTLLTSGAALLCAVLNFLQLPNAVAGTHTWTGAAGGGLWSAAGNWTGNNKPFFGETDLKIVFPTNGTATSTIDIAGLVVNEFLIQRSNSISISGTAGMKVTLQDKPGFTAINLLSGGATFQTSLELVLSNDCLVFVNGEQDCYYDPPYPPDCVYHYGGPLMILSKVTGPGGLSFTGIGESTLGGTVGNGYLGETYVSLTHSLFLNKSSGNAVPANLNIAGGNVTLLDDHQIANTASVLNSGVIWMTNHSEGFGPLTMNLGVIHAEGGQVTLTADLTAYEGSDSDYASVIYGNVSLGTLPPLSRGRSISVLANANLVIRGTVSGGAMTPVIKEGAGTLVLEGASTFDGVMNVSEGTLVAEGSSTPLGSTNGYTQVSPGASLWLRGPWIPPVYFGNGYYSASTNAEPIILRGGTLGGYSDSEARGSVTLTTNSFFDGSVVVNSSISGTGSVWITGDVWFVGNQPNTYTGETIVEGGYLALNKSPAITAVPHNLVLTNYGYTDGRVILKSSHQIADAASVTLYPDSTFDLDTALETITSLDMTGGEVAGSGGLLTLLGNITATPPTNSAFESTISGALHLKSGASHFIHVNPGNAATAHYFQNELVIEGVVSSDASIGFTKTGSGRLELSGANTFSGAIVVDEGGIIASHGSAFGGAGPNGVYLYDGGFAYLSDDISIGNEGLSFRGGTLLTGKGTHEWKGVVTLVSNAVVEVSNQFAGLTFSGAISGTGSFTKNGAGRIEFAGNGANTFSGIISVNAGELWLCKTNVLAVPSHIIVGTSTNGATLRLFGSGEIGGSSYVIAEHFGSIFDVQGFVQTIGTFTGNGAINIGNGGLLAVGGDGYGAGFAGGAISGSGTLQKLGSDTFTLSGNSAGFSGATLLTAGTLVVNGSLANSPVTVASVAKLAGSGSVGIVNGSGMISPGNSPGKLTTKHFTNAASSTLMIELNGTTAGMTYDQIDVTGTVKLGGTLQVTRGSNTPPNSQFTIIKNDSNDAVIGTFNGLPQSSQFTIGGAKFQISYTGGDGNDVVLTQVSTATNALMRGVAKMVGGTMQIGGTGSPSFNYSLQANTNLNTTNWITLGTITAAGDGGLLFNDASAGGHPMRFYRFVIP